MSKNKRIDHGNLGPETPQSPETNGIKRGAVPSSKQWKVRYSYLPQQFQDCDDLWADLKRLVAIGDFTLGPSLAQFEKRFADVIGAQHAIGVNSGTDAIKLSLKALNVEELMDQESG